MINRKKTQRLYREEGLMVRRRRNRRRAIGARAPAPVLALPNQRWSLDFVHDQMASGRRFRSEEPTSEIQSLMRLSYAVFCLNKKKTTTVNKSSNTATYD